jgi:cell division protein FtsQ
MRRLNDIPSDVDDGGPPAAAVNVPRGGLRTRPRRRWLPQFWWKKNRRIAIAAALVVGGVGVPLWAVQSGASARLFEQTRQQVLDASARAGLRVDEIFVEGRNRTARKELLAAIKTQRGDPIFGVDLSATRQRLQDIPWVETAAVERRLPNELRVTIRERTPAVLWQSQGHYFLVDAEGQVMGEQVEDFVELPLLVGEGAPDHVADLLDLFKAEPDLTRQVKASQWVGMRRWNITLDRPAGPVEIRLPEEDPVAAWHELAKLDREQNLLSRAVSVIDMRLPDRLVLRATGAGEQPSPIPRSKAKPRPGKDT